MVDAGLSLSRQDVDYITNYLKEWKWQEKFQEIPGSDLVTNNVIFMTMSDFLKTRKDCLLPLMLGINYCNLPIKEINYWDDAVIRLQSGNFTFVTLRELTSFLYRQSEPFR